MAKNVKDTYSIAEDTLSALKSNGLSAEPKNYEVWFTYASGESPALARDMQSLQKEDGAFEQDDVDEVFSRHIGRNDLSKDVLLLVEKFQSAVNKLADAVEETGENNTTSTNELASFSAELKAAADGHPAITNLVDSVVAATSSVVVANKKLESQLEQSSQEVSRLRVSVETVQREALRDPLTGIHNRKSFDKKLVELSAKARAENTPLALIFADVDHFKNFNDTWGHQTGDQVLRLVAEVMNANIKGQDILARYGGEEFTIILPETSRENAIMLADRIRKSIEARRIKKRRTNADLGSITMSMGVATLQPGESEDILVERADSLLYLSKANGRNCVTAEDEQDSIASIVA